MKTKNIKILLVNTKYSKNLTTFIEAAVNSNYNVEKELLKIHNIQDHMEEALKLNNIVITAGDAAEVCLSASRIFNEPLVENCTVPFRFPPRLKVISSDLLCTQSLFIVINEIGFNDLMEIITGEWKEIEYTKIINVTMNDSVKNYVPKLKEGDNGLNINIIDDCTIKIKSNNFNEVIRAYKKLHGNFSTNILSSNFVDESFNFVYLCEDEIIQSAIQIIEDCFKQYGPENVFISFNGGKDCTVLLHLMLAVLNKNYPNYSRPFCMYVQSTNPFSEINEFIENVSLYYNLNIVTVTSGIKEALQSILNKHPNFKAVFLGTRRMDPFSQNMEHFQMTDKNWPSIMRVSPLLDWDYGHIWDYLLKFRVPYCSLYDEGFTSLGNVNNTKKNPMLLHRKICDEFYLPAYKLFDGTKERLGRT